ncbi:DUF7504 family protein [Natranaeroarchaeum sulfidigenes]|uniref:KaiC-like protein ATPase n=1 Tax=Natranaeroarchaeum sulfidigenes TaxID=2784880 RepID=A0A897MP17_9EURY|nr:hypothetical protein [Natranaeroarchaeum sulfidigenes]QSG02334.1 KaiC-like protein ATPase [Natranaeroarchaeum sulfidigenes]
MSDETIDVIEGGSVLLLGVSGSVTEECCDTLLDVGPAASRAEIRVSFPVDITDRPRLDTGTTGRQPNKHGQITVGDVLRSAESSSPDFDAPVASDIVEDPGNLTGIGTSVSKFCETWSTSDHRIVLCFDSITRLLEHSDPEVVFQFLHTLLERLDGVDTVSHFHIDPDSHDEQLISTVSSLFDQVVDPNDPGELLDESNLEDETDDTEPSLSDGIPATSGSSQASDDDIAARLNDQPRTQEDSTQRRGASSSEATDDDIAEQLDELDSTEPDE